MPGMRLCHLIQPPHMETVVVLWTLRRMLRSPLVWLTWATSLAALPALVLLSPLGTVSASNGGGSIDVLLATALVGTVIGIEAGASLEPMTARLGQGRARLEGTVLVTAGLAAIAPTWLASTLLWPPSGHHLSIFFTGVALMALHASALGWLLGSLPIPHRSRSILLVFLAWPMAGWISPSSLPMAALAALIDVSHAARVDLGAATWSARIASVAPIMVLVGLRLAIQPTPSDTSCDTGSSATSTRT